MPFLHEKFQTYMKRKTPVSWSPIIPNQQPEMFCNYVILNKNQIAHIDWQLISLLFCGFNILGGSAGRESACNVGDLGSIPEFGRFPAEGKSYPLQYSGLENSMHCISLGVAKSQTWLSHFHSHFQSGKSGHSYIYIYIFFFSFSGFCIKVGWSHCLSWK